MSLLPDSNPTLETPYHVSYLLLPVMHPACCHRLTRQLNDARDTVTQVPMGLVTLLHRTAAQISILQALMDEDSSDPDDNPEAEEEDFDEDCEAYEEEEEVCEDTEVRLLIHFKDNDRY